MDNEPVFLKWFNWGKSYSAIGEYFEGDIPPTYPITLLLDIKSDEFKPSTKDILQHLETTDDFKKLKTGLHAFLQFQDILDIPLDIKNPLENRHYCYYESLIYLRESVVSWLDKNVLAGLTLLRPFLELSILHLYWDLYCRNKGYEYFYRWLDGKKEKPPFRNQVDYIFSNLPTKDTVNSKKLKARKELLLKDYSVLCSYNHTPRIDESITRMSDSSQNVTLEAFYYYLATVNILIRHLVYIYVLTYPMSMFPVNKYQKWGVGGVLGIFFDECNFAIVKAYLGAENTEQLQSNFSSMKQIHSLLEWYENTPNMTPQEIEGEWDKLKAELKCNDVDSIGERIALNKSHIRTLGWVTNYVSKRSPVEDISEEISEKMKNIIENW